MQEVLVGRYVLGEELGRGGMARVVRARDLRLDRDVAVKLLGPAERAAVDPASRARFVREARAAASFIHPHAVSVFDAGDADGVLYLVMELIDGPSLSTLLARDGAFEIDRARQLVDQVLQALGAAHRAGIVHRDVKAGNVLVTGDGVAKLSDFGIAKRFDDLATDLTMPGHVVGTPSSMAPEQVTGQPATPATDVYATGVLLFQLLVDGPPFDAGSSLATALAHRDAPVPDVRDRRPEVPADLASVIRTAMAKDPWARFASADEMRAALAAQPDPTSVATMVRPVATSSERSVRRWWWPAVGVAVATAVVVALLGRTSDPSGPAAGTVAPTAAAPTTAPPTTASVEVVTTTPNVAPAPAPAPTPAPSPTPTPGPTTTAPVPTVAGAPATAGEVVALIDADPTRFGPHAAELRRDLERIQDRAGRQLERDVQRLRDRLAAWRADGSIGPEVAVIVDAVLTTAPTGQDDQEDDRPPDG